MSDSAPMAYIEWVDSAPSADELAPKQVGALSDQKAAKGDKSDATTTTAKAPAKEKSDATKKRPGTGSKRAAGIAKRADARTRKAKASPTPLAKAKSRVGVKNARGGKRK